MNKLIAVLSTLGSSALILMVLSLAVKILPDSPFLLFASYDSPVGAFAEYLPYIAYFIPLDRIAVVLETWVGCIAYWYIWRFTYSTVKQLSISGPTLMLPKK